MNRVEVPPLPGEDHSCSECGFSYLALDVGEARAVITAVPDRTRAAALAVPDPRRRLAPSRWSALEYVCHLRDVYISSTIRLYRVRTEDRPSLEPMLNDLRTARFRHNEMSLPAVLDELGLTVLGFLDEVDRVRPDGWTRTATRLPGEERTALWFVRHAAHEGVHHIRDIEAS
ncbi:DinB family protein [Pseudonocardia eucalypti]|uniref:DinB family protein n=1 Tax=Pseudonocardia eucalypti TaxID=648755 RepID=A0ABP9Q5R9_9PSEU